MTPNSELSASAVAGQALQDKYELYALALAWTTLAAASQTAHFGSLLAADILELAAWALLLASGIVAMVRLERKPNIYHLASILSGAEHLRDEAQAALLRGTREIFIASTGELQNMDSYLATAKASVVTVHDEFEQHRTRSVKLYRAHSFTLFGGIALLVIARALPAILSVIARIRG